MGESHENLLKAVRHYQESLDKYTENRNDGKLLHYLEKLYKLPIKVVHLEQTGVGRTVNGLRKLGGEVGDSARCLVTKWKEMVVGEQEEEEDDDEDEEEDEEDGYQTGEDSDEKETKEERTRSDNSSSHRKSDSNRTEERDKARKSSKHRDSSKEKKDKHRHHRNNGHSSSKHKSHKRKSEDSSSEEESARKKQKKDASSEEDRHSEAETRSSKEKKHHRSDEERRKHKTKKLPDSSSENEDTRTKNKDKHKAKKESESKKHEHSSKKAKEKERKSESSRSKETHKKSDDKKHKSSKSKPQTKVLSHNGIDSGSGASFAEALGMCEPSSSKNSSKKKASTSSEKKEKEKSNNKTEELMPKLLKDPVPPVPVEALDINISSLLPPITPNYRPLGNLLPTDNQPKKYSNEYEALSHIITSKNQRTKVYSGNKMGCGKVASLFELCVRVLQDNIDELGYTGGVPYSVLKPILEKSTPNQLYILEHHNPYLIEDTDELWAVHCQKEFRNKKREEFESWREMYLRCLDERDAKLKALTANIKQAQDKSLPVRTTKLAYVDAVAKPPRNIARKQLKNGTSVPERKTVKLTALATAGEAGKVAVPNPGSRAAERHHSAAAPKPKKAPLMLKSISSFKNRFKR